MKTRISLLLAVAALGLALPARAQNTTVDSRWLAFLGCWEPVEHVKSLVCVVPAGTGTIELLTIKKGEVVSRERIAATGQRAATTAGDCTGWQTGESSPIAVRIYLRSAETCAGAISRAGSAIIAMTGTGKGDWVYVQGMTLGGAAGRTGVRVQRYRDVNVDDVLLPDEVRAALPTDLVASMRARTWALAPLAVNDVVEASHAVDEAVVQAWLVERGRPFAIDAKKLVALADAGVPTSVIDLIVALSYPRAFAVNAGTWQGERLSKGLADTTYAANGPGQCSSTSYGFDPYYDPYYDCTARYGYGYNPYGYGYGYPYGYDWSFGGPVIVYNPSGGGGGGGSGTPRQHGRVVNGQGYQGNSDSGTSAQPRSGQSGSTSSGSSGSPSGSSSSSSGSSSGGERTAHHRP